MRPQAHDRCPRYALFVLLVLSSLVAPQVVARGATVQTSDAQDVPEVVIQQPHASHLGYVCVTPDRRTWVTVGLDSTGIRVWDGDTRMLVRVLRAQTPWLWEHRTVAVVDDRRLAIDEERALRIVDMRSGRDVASIPHADDQEHSAHYLLPVESGDQVVVARSVKGVSDRTRLFLVDVARGEVVHDLDVPYSVEALARYDDDSFLVFCESADEEESSRTALLLSTTDLAEVNRFDNIGFGEVLRYTQGGRSRIIAPADRAAEKAGVLTLYDLENEYAEIGELTHDGSRVTASDVLFLDASTAITWSSDLLFEWNLQGPKLESTWQIRKRTDLRFTEAWLGDEDGTFRFGAGRFDPASRTLEVPEGSVDSIGTRCYWRDQEDSTYFDCVVGDTPALGAIAEVLFGVEFRQYKPALRFGDDGRYVVMVFRQGFGIFDMQEEEAVLRRELPPGSYAYQPAVFDKTGSRVAFLPGSIIMAPPDPEPFVPPDHTADWPALLYALPSGEPIAKVNRRGSDGESICWTDAAFSPDGSMLVLSDDHHLCVYDTETWEEVKCLETEVDAIEFISDQALLVARPDGSFDQVLLPWCAVDTAVAHSSFGATLDLSLSQSGERITSVVSGGVVETYALPEVEKILTSFVLPEGNWLHLAPDGRFDSSPDGGKYVTWRWKGRVYGFDQFESRFRSPEVIRNILMNEAPTPLADATPPPDITQQFQQGAPPEVEILSPSAGERVSADAVQVAFRASSDRGLESLVITANGRHLSDRRGLEVLPSLTGEQLFSASVSVPLDAGTNRISIVAIDRDGSRSSPASIEVVRVLPEPIKPDLWILAVGVSRHSNPRLSLDFAGADARGVSAALEKTAAAADLFADIHTNVIVDGDAHRAGILDALDGLIAGVDEKDVVVLFLAGHGVRDERLNYYFVAHDSDLESLRATGLRWTDLEYALGDLAAKKVLLLADTCHGGAITGERKVRAVDTEEIALELVKGQGVVVLASSTAGEVSEEDRSWRSSYSRGHGAFSYALIEGLEGEADRSGDSVLTVFELLGYVSERVREITDGRQHPSAPRLESFVDFPLGVAGAGG